MPNLKTLSHGQVMTFKMSKYLRRLRPSKKEFGTIENLLVITSINTCINNKLNMEEAK